MRSLLLFSVIVLLVFGQSTVVFAEVFTPKNYNVDISYLQTPVYVDDRTQLRIAVYEVTAGQQHLVQPHTLQQPTLHIVSQGIKKTLTLTPDANGTYQVSFFPTAVGLYEFVFSAEANGEEIRKHISCSNKSDNLPCPLRKEIASIPYPHYTLNDLLYDRWGAEFNVEQKLNSRLGYSQTLNIISVSTGLIGLGMGYEAYRRSKRRDLQIVYPPRK
jgi:hypothetical protein